MNKETKDLLKEAQSQINEARATIEQIRDEQQEDFDDKSDKWKESDAATTAEEGIANLTDAADILETAITHLDEALS